MVQRNLDRFNKFDLPVKITEALFVYDFGEWWTDTVATADENGEVRTRAFYGDYVITVDGERKNVTLSKAEGTVEVAF